MFGIVISGKTKQITYNLNNLKTANFLNPKIFMLGLQKSKNYDEQNINKSNVFKFCYYLFFSEDDTFNLKIVCSSNEKKKSTALNVDKRDFSCKDMLSDDTFHQPKKLKIKKKNQDNYFRPEKPKRTEAEQCKNRIFFNIQTLPSNK